MTQSWKCAKCGASYESPVKISNIFCGTRNCNGRPMDFVEGDKPDWLLVRENRERRKVRPRVGVVKELGND